MQTFWWRIVTEIRVTRGDAMKKFGSRVDRSLIVVLPAAVRSFDEKTSIVAGTSDNLSSRLRAVTTISSSAAGSVCRWRFWRGLRGGLAHRSLGRQNADERQEQGFGVETHVCLLPSFLYFSRLRTPSSALQGTWSMARAAAKPAADVELAAREAQASSL